MCLADSSRESRPCRLDPLFWGLWQSNISGQEHIAEQTCSTQSHTTPKKEEGHEVWQSPSMALAWWAEDLTLSPRLEGFITSQSHWDQTSKHGLSGTFEIRTLGWSSLLCWSISLNMIFQVLFALLQITTFFLFMSNRWTTAYVHCVFLSLHQLMGTW